MAAAKKAAALAVMAVAVSMVACAPRPEPRTGKDLGRPGGLSKETTASSLPRDIEPIVRRRCGGCHGERGVAHELTTLDDWQAERERIREVVTSREMPPDFRLESSERRLLLQWLEEQRRP